MAQIVKSSKLTMQQNQAAQLPAYAELLCFSNFSFLHGASHAEELAERAQQLGYSALAITDECSLAGVVRAHVAAQKVGLPLIIGSYFQLQDEAGEPTFSVLLLATNRNGYGNLSELITLGRTRAEKGSYRLHARDFYSAIAGHAHLRGMPDCLAILLPPYPAVECEWLAQASNIQAGQLPDAALGQLRQQVQWLKQSFGARSWLGHTNLLRAYDDIHRAALEQVAQETQVPLVALGQVNMHVRSRKPLQDCVTALAHNAALADCTALLAPNAEQHLRARQRFAALFSSASLQETLHIAAQCQFSLNELRYEYPDEIVPPGMTPASYLRQETLHGAARRYPEGAPPKVLQQIEHELALVAEMRYEPYFLTVYDIVHFARRENILCQGRGSAANSAVCYCLGITEVDPARSNMLFERFISKERNEPPDIDVDFEHQRREEVIQYIYRKYGRERAALAAAVSTYRPKSALRDSGRALGIDLFIIDQVCKSHRWFDSSADLLPRFAECGLDPASTVVQHWANLAHGLLGMPRHLSQHSGGFVIARGKLSRLVPIENAAMPERSVIQWDKDDLDALGLLKIDVLALGMLSAIQRALHLVSEQRGYFFELQDIPAEDPATYEMMCRADTVGVFQIESRAQMSMLPRLQPRCFYDLVIEVALVRPGPIQGDMVHPYLRRRQGLEAVSYPSPQVATALQRTLGIPIFQEQVMQVAMLAAGFTAGEADQLRRAMAAWKRKGNLQQYYEKIVNGMLARGYQREFAESIYKQIQGFAEYGFPESHAASFALLVYASAWLKCHEPAAFLCALLNSQPMGFYSPSQLVQDARRHQVEVRPVDVLVSDWDSTLEPIINGNVQEGVAVRLGMSRISGMRMASAQRIVAARRSSTSTISAATLLTDLADLAQRANLDRSDLQALAASNALLGLTGHRRSALWHAAGAVPDKDLLRGTQIEESQPKLKQPSAGEELILDYQSLGLTLGQHPLALLRKQLFARRFATAQDLQLYQNDQLARACGLVTVRQRPATAKGVLFMTLEDETGNVNLIIWPALLEQQRQIVLNAKLLGVYGIWQREGEVRHLVAKRLVDMTHMLGRLVPKSHDFF